MAAPQSHPTPTLQQNAGRSNPGSTDADFPDFCPLSDRLGLPECRSSSYEVLLSTMAGIKSQLFRSGLSALWFSGAARVLAPWTAGRGAILMMHRVQPATMHGPFTPNATLSITPGYLDALLRSFRAECIDVIGLDEAMQRVAAAGASRPFVCFTFDDGYRDNLEHAMPVFQRHGAPFTVYATSSFVERSLDPWWCVLEHIIGQSTRVDWRTSRDETLYDTTDLAAKYLAFGALTQAFLQLSVAEVRVQLQRLVEDHGLRVGEVAERETCSFAELRALRAGGAEIGCHTVSHALLMRESESVVCHELTAARATLEAGLGCPVTHLAYPYGKRDHVGSRELALAKELGFATATTTRKGALFAIHAQHRHGLPRVEVTQSFAGSTHYLRTILSGLPLMIWNRGQRAIID
jgi:peptidoglycan/xylan/chitin deacetylase (PgdA/CDA1 family)